MRRRKRFTLIRIGLALAVAAILPVTAQARPNPGPTSHLQGQYKVGPGEIPYLSQGHGVNEADFGPGRSADDRNVARGTVVSAQEQVVIPYMSQGTGVTSTELGFTVGKSPDDRSFARATTLETTSVVSDGGSSIDISPYTVSGFGLALLLVMFGMGLAIRHNRKGNLSPA
jgi:hypothetical protein